MGEQTAGVFRPTRGEPADLVTLAVATDVEKQPLVPQNQMPPQHIHGRLHGPAVVGSWEHHPSPGLQMYLQKPERTGDGFVVVVVVRRDRLQPGDFGGGMGWRRDARWPRPGPPPGLQDRLRQEREAFRRSVLQQRQHPHHTMTLEQRRLEFTEGYPGVVAWVVDEGAPRVDRRGGSVAANVAELYPIDGLSLAEESSQTWKGGRVVGPPDASPVEKQARDVAVEWQALDLVEQGYPLGGAAAVQGDGAPPRSRVGVTEGQPMLEQVDLGRVSQPDVHPRFWCRVCWRRIVADGHHGVRGDGQGPLPRRPPEQRACVHGAQQQAPLHRSHTVGEGPTPDATRQHHHTALPLSITTTTTPHSTQTLQRSDVVALGGCREPPLPVVQPSNHGRVQVDACHLVCSVPQALCPVHGFLGKSGGHRHVAAYREGLCVCVTVPGHTLRTATGGPQRADRRCCNNRFHSLGACTTGTVVVMPACSVALVVRLQCALQRHTPGVDHLHGTGTRVVVRSLPSPHPHHHPVW